MKNGKETKALDLPTLLAKAVRRAEKLEKSLLKIVADSDRFPDSERFLKAVQRGLKKLRTQASPDGPVRKRAAVKKPKAAAPKKARAKRSPRPAAEGPGAS